MDSRNTPYRSEVVCWSPDDLADYFKRLNFKDCEKVVKKHHITGKRFLNLSENDIQRFPKLRVPILSKLSQEINRHEERRSFFPKRNQTQKVSENIVFGQPEDGGWSSFESDDYESPDDNDLEEDVDYETPNDNGIEEENDADYEPPPSNDDNALRNVIFPSKSMPATSEYIDRPSTERSKAMLQPPVPPQRPGSSPTPLTPRGRDTGQPPFLPPASNNESNRVKSVPSFKPPSVDRSKKPPLDRSGPPFDREQPGAGKRSYPEMTLAPQLRSLGAELVKMQKPPVPSADKCERSNPASRRKPPSMKNSQISERKAEMDEDCAPQRPVPQPSFHTFPFRSKPPSKQSPVPPKVTPEVHTESAAALSVPLPPPHFQSGSISRTFSKGPADGRPPLPIPNRQTVQYPKAEKEQVENSQIVLPPCEPKVRFGSGAGSHREAIQGPANQKWYVADITRPEAEVALRTINKDGTYLVRNSSRKTLEQPYVLMVLYHNKVYNIQIRYRQERNVYFLGTGMNANEEFTSVAEIIDHFQRTPLLLIDGKDRGSRKQCMLTFVAEHL